MIVIDEIFYFTTEQASPFISNVDWGSLLSAFVGAFLSILFWTYIEFLRGRKIKKDNIAYIEKYLIVNSEKLIQAKQTIEKFIEDRLKKTLADIEKDGIEEIYSIHRSFFPLFEAGFIDAGIMKIRTGSTYIDNQLLVVYNNVNDFSSAIIDLREQLTSTFELNEKMAMQKVNSPRAQGAIMRDNLKAFIKFAEDDFLEKNIKIHLKNLTQTRLALIKYNKIGGFRWQVKFAPRWKFFFFSNKKYKEYCDSKFKVIDQYFEKETEEEIQKILKNMEAS
ncbi:MAG: hypothetical protein PHE20_03135 [Patescibacteria group bacterium]|nr:hypothetical protein [Patescibacteria group bacterium]